MSSIKNAPIKLQISMFVAMMLITLFGVGLVNFTSSATLVSKITAIYDDIFIPMNLINNIKGRITVVDSISKQLVLSQKNLATSRQVQHDIQFQIKEIKLLINEYKSSKITEFEAEWLNNLFIELESYSSDTLKSIELKNSSKEEDAYDKYFKNSILHFDTFNTILGVLNEHATEKAKFQNNAAREVIENTNMLIIVFSVVGLIFEIFFGVFLSRIVTVPLKYIVSQIKEISKGKYQFEHIYDNPKNEIGQLSLAIKNMTMDLNSISIENQRMYHHMEEIIDERTKELEQKTILLEKIATHDILTNLPNRMLFNARLQKSIELASLSNEMVALLFIDLDGFKQINDKYGHESGDIVLKTISNRLLDSIRTCDTVSRLGGDEFTIILASVRNIEGIVKTCNRILNAIRKEIELKNGELEIVGGSIGVSIYPNDSLEIDNLISEADKAMYNAKNAGKNRFVFAGNYGEKT